MSLEDETFAVGDQVYLETDGGGMAYPSIVRGTITRETKLYWIVTGRNDRETRIRKDTRMKPSGSMWSPGTKMYRIDSPDIQNRLRLQAHRNRLRRMSDLIGKLQRAGEVTEESLDLARQLQELAIRHHSDLVQSTRV